MLCKVSRTIPIAEKITCISIIMQSVFLLTFLQQLHCLMCKQHESLSDFGVGPRTILLPESISAYCQFKTPSIFLLVTRCITKFLTHVFYTLQILNNSSTNPTYLGVSIPNTDRSMLFSNAVECKYM